MLFYFLLNIITLVIFLNGFFPYNNNDSNSDENTSLQFVKTATVLEEYDRTIIVVIDALRLDFVDATLMPITTRLAKEHGCFIDVKVESPTVTLPRIKALSTGSVPQFIDILLNFGDPQVLQDSLLHRAVAKKKNLVFYGDNTWLKLYPNIFLRQEGTSSFYVNDFYEVDSNVTRNVNMELEKSDWDMMILHYLGLDHIGHVFGPTSSLVPAKLNEMDTVIEKIYNATLLKTNRSLILITGDHGMKDSGGHGGSTYSEIHVPLVVLGTSCRNDSIDQVDIAANLATLMNLEIPSSSIGKIKKLFLNSLTMGQYLEALRYNTNILRNKKDICGNEFELAEKFHELFLTNNDYDSGQKAAEIFEKCSREISTYLIKSSVSQDLIALITSIMFLIIFLINVVTNIQNLNIMYINFSIYKFIILFVLLNMKYISSYILYILGGIYMIFKLVEIIQRVNPPSQVNFLTISGIILTILQPVTWFSSSFIEEEHQYWYFLLISFSIVHILKNYLTCNIKFLFTWIVISISLRFLRTLNQTGDRWAHLPDLSDFLTEKDNVVYLHILFILSLIFVWHICHNMSRSKIAQFLSLFVLILIYFFKANDNRYTLLGKILYLLILIYFCLDQNSIVTWLLISCLLLKPYNILLLSFCVQSSLQIMKEYKNKLIAILFHLWLSKTIFFMQGHSNSLASVDITPGYIGLSSYQPLLVASQVICHVYIFPILSHLLLLQHTTKNYRYESLNFFYLYQMSSITMFCIISLIFKDHISVWTIYAPKLIIESLHTGILFCEVSLIYVTSILKELYRQNLQNKILS